MQKGAHSGTPFFLKITKNGIYSALSGLVLAYVA
jgi:hypothetical protein